MIYLSPGLNIRLHSRPVECPKLITHLLGFLRESRNEAINLQFYRSMQLTTKKGIRTVTVMKIDKEDS